MTLNTLPRLAPFPDDNRRYRLTSLGELHLNAAVRSHPTVRVWLTPIREKCGASTDFGDNRIYECRRSTFVDAGIGIWPSLKVGEIWWNGEVVESPDYETKVFRDIQPSRLVPSFVCADASVPASNSRRSYPLISFSAYPFPFDRKGSRLSVFDAVDDASGESVTLIIPCAETVRFFLFSSTGMTETLLSGEPLTHHLYGVFNPRWTALDPTTLRGHVRLRQKIKNVEAHIAGLIGLSAYARRCAESVYESLVSNKEEFGYATIDAYPPFKDVGNLCVRGKTIRVGSENSFLVFSIKTCSAEFPWDTLSYTRDNGGGRRGSSCRELPEVGYPQRIQQRPRTDGGGVESETEDQLVLQFDEEPSRLYEPTNLFVVAQRFTKLDLHKIKQIDREDENSFRAAARRYGDEHNGPFGMGLGSWRDTDPPPFEVAQKERIDKRTEPLPARLNDFRCMLVQLELMDHVTLNPLELTNGEENATPGFSYMPYVNGWCYVDRPRKQRRRVIVIHALFRNFNFYLFEIEKRPMRGENEENFAALILHKQSGNEVDNAELELVLGLCAKRRGVWFDENQFDLVRKRMVHKFDRSDRSKTAEVFARRFYDYFLENAVRPHKPPEILESEAQAA